MKFNIYSADVTGEPTNCLYPHKNEVETPEQLAEALSKDNVACRFRNDYRQTENIESADCVVMDYDNDDTEKPEEMLTKEKISGRWPDVAMAAAPSRNNMKPKNGKAPRPKGHVVFPIKETSDAGYIAALKRGIRKACPQFDKKCLDAPHFIFGAEMSAEDILWQEGEKTIDEVIEPVWEDETEKKPQPKPMGVIPMGERNNTLSRFAGRVLKKFGETEYAHDAFLTEAAKCEEPLPGKELDTIWRSAVKFYRSRVESSDGYVPPDEYNADFDKAGSLKPEDYSDIGEAKVLVREYGDELVFTTATDYLRYDGKVWNESKQKAIGAMEEFLDLQLADAMLLCSIRKQALLDAGADRMAVESGTKRDIKDFDEEQYRLFLEYKEALSYYAFVMKRRDMKYVMSTLQAAKPMLEVPIDRIDGDPYLLNTPEGTYDLRKGMDGLHPHDPKDFITKITAVSPSDEGKEDWTDQLEKTFLGNAQTIGYTQMSLGEALFGKVENEHMTIAHGGGRNGKSTVCNSCAGVLGSYSGVISADVLTAGVRRNVKPEIAEIKGKRLLIAGELEEGMRLSTSIVKQLCSTDPIKGEKKYKDPFDFIPTHSLILYTNHLPKVGAMDEGIWRRLVVIPFNAKFEGKSDIKNYTDHLISHAGGYILKWLIEGAKKMYDADFRIDNPPEVQAAIDKYRQDNDWFSHFLEECCETGDTLEIRSGELYDAYRAYCSRTGDYVRSTTEFYSEVESRGFHRIRRNTGRFVLGLKMKEEGAGEDVPF